MLQDESKEGAATDNGVAAGQCTGDLSPPSDDFEYQLFGKQVEPGAGLWLTGNRISVPRLVDVVRFSEGADTNPRWNVTAEDFPDEAQFGPQLRILRDMAKDRGDYPYPADREYTASQGGVCETLKITHLSRFLQLQPPPFGTIFDVIAHVTDGIDRGEVNNQRGRINMSRLVIDQGQELARAFENETPGLFHRHALNWLLYNRPDISPPRQARIWLALDMAIYAALSACWYYKWWDPRWSRLLRPSEYARRCTGRELNVLYDDAVDDNGRETDATPRPPTDPNNPNNPEAGSPGTPRHPAWPSGHSTYSAAASHILEYFLSPDTLTVPDEQLRLANPAPKPNYVDPVWVARELRRLANNIGEARLWAGVHWTSDHAAGQKIGRAAAQAVIEQLERDGVEPMNPAAPATEPPAAAPFPPDQPPNRPAPSQGQDTIRPAVPGPQDAMALRRLPPT